MSAQRSLKRLPHPAPSVGGDEELRDGDAGCVGAERVWVSPRARRVVVVLVVVHEKAPPDVPFDALSVVNNAESAPALRGRRRDGRRPGLLRGELGRDVHDASLEEELAGADAVPDARDPVSRRRVSPLQQAKRGGRRHHRHHRREEDDRDRGEPRTRAASLTIEHHRRSTTLNMTKPASRAIYAALSAALRYVSRRARLFEKLRKISAFFKGDNWARMSF